MSKLDIPVFNPKKIKIFRENPQGNFRKVPRWLTSAMVFGTEHATARDYQALNFMLDMHPGTILSPEILMQKYQSSGKKMSRSTAFEIFHNLGQSGHVKTDPQRRDKKGRFLRQSYLISEIPWYFGQSEILDTGKIDDVDQNVNQNKPLHQTSSKNGQSGNLDTDYNKERALNRKKENKRSRGEPGGTPSLAAADLVGCDYIEELKTVASGSKIPGDLVVKCAGLYGGKYAHALIIVSNTKKDPGAYFNAMTNLAEPATWIIDKAFPPPAVDVGELEAVAYKKFTDEIKVKDIEIQRKEKLTDEFITNLTDDEKNKILHEIKANMHPFMVNRIKMGFIPIDGNEDYFISKQAIKNYIGQNYVS